MNLMLFSCRKGALRQIISARGIVEFIVSRAGFSAPLSAIAKSASETIVAMHMERELTGLRINETALKETLKGREMQQFFRDRHTMIRPELIPFMQGSVNFGGILDRLIGQPSNASAENSSFDQDGLHV